MFPRVAWLIVACSVWHTGRAAFGDKDGAIGGLADGGLAHAGGPANAAIKRLELVEKVQSAAIADGLALEKLVRGKVHDLEKKLQDTSAELKVIGKLLRQTAVTTTADGNLKKLKADLIAAPEAAAPEAAPGAAAPSLMQPFCNKQGLDVFGDKFGEVRLLKSPDARLGVKKNRLAVCLVGQMRSFPLSYMQWQKIRGNSSSGTANLWDVLDAQPGARDFFYVGPQDSAYETWKPFIGSVGLAAQFVYSPKLTVVSEGDFSNATWGTKETVDIAGLPHVAINKAYYGDSGYGQDSLLIQAYQASKCASMVRKYETQHGVKYARVARLRTDNVLGCQWTDNLHHKAGACRKAADKASADHQAWAVIQGDHFMFGQADVMLDGVLRALESMHAQKSLGGLESMWHDVNLKRWLANDKKFENTELKGYRHHLQNACGVDMGFYRILRKRKGYWMDDGCDSGLGADVDRCMQMAFISGPNLTETIKWESHFLTQGHMVVPLKHELGTAKKLGFGSGQDGWRRLD